ncbi:hypothetical protein [Methanobrevibacter thaueri]|uniref:Uncharacterized protein n=1 Tax=Methanobrevibacter thaueri TaxID=190975 RepID=A0A315XNC2_9EURY|nr:hypothetical protein [Methanobrevibacter thaueri]PWB87887.1 hypothetical protein MBBTH_04740 [Methanobrevibacter thaueri]
MQEINLVMFQFSEDTPFQFYWNPMIIGETITGHIYMISTDEYGAEIIILKIKDPYYDIKYLVRIPPHPSIMECYSNINIGDYLKIQYVNKVPGVDSFDEKIFNIKVNCNK